MACHMAIKAIYFDTWQYIKHRPLGRLLALDGTTVRRQLLCLWNIDSQTLFVRCSFVVREKA